MCEVISFYSNEFLYYNVNQTYFWKSIQYHNIYNKTETLFHEFQ